VTWICPECLLDDRHLGAGDGIGSCDCVRCDCCGAGPQQCDCRRDFDPYQDDEDEPFDYLCNDTACSYRAGRIAGVVQ